MERLKLVLILCFVFTAYLSGTCQGAKITVGPHAGYNFNSIQAAIDIANSGDEIEVAPGTYFEKVNLLGKQVRLYSSHGPQVTIIDGSEPVILLNDDFSDGNYDGWRIVDQGNANGPSDWKVLSGRFVQESNIHNSPLTDPKMLGTFAVWDDTQAMSWDNYALTFTMMSADDDAMGVMFRYQDENNYYRLCWLRENHNQGVGRLQLSRMQNGVFTVLAHSNGAYEINMTYNIKIVVSGAYLQALINDYPILSAIDSTFSGGSAALFCWGNEGTYFDNIVVKKLAYTVQCVSGEGADTVIDGFTITGGSSDGYDIDKIGGGMYNKQSSPTVSNCIFAANTAYDGGGMYNLNSSPAVNGCIFKNNSSGAAGGGMYNYQSSPKVSRCSFNSNKATTTGGGMYSRHYSSPVITDSMFTGNSAPGGGGAMVNSVATPAKMVNCIFQGNTTVDKGGAIYNYYYSQPTISNCTFSQNTAADGGAIFNLENCNSTVSNSIFWANSSGQIYNVNSSPNVIYSNVQGGYTGTGNINADPLFVDAAGGNLWLSFGSPCIDAGNNSSVTAGTTTDLNGWPRFIDDMCKMDSGNGTAPVVDMGAYEFLPADITGSGRVSFDDLSIIAANWALSSGDLAGADLNCDGMVALADMAILASYWQAGFDVPEPLTQPILVWVDIADSGFNGKMSKYEISNTEFSQYLNAALASGDIVLEGNYIKGNSGLYSGQNYYRLDGPGLTEAGAVNGGRSRINYSDGRFRVESGFGSHPVTYVSWYGATAFASYYGWRLPTQPEWQAVADYNDGRVYATGNALYDNERFLANYRANGYDGTAPNDLLYHPWVEHGTSEVGYFGTFGHGLADMAGNITEWTSSVFDVKFAHLGDCWYGYGYKISTIGLSYPYVMSQVIGFRVCR